MKKITFVLIIISSILCNACKKEDLTDTIDITMFSWKIKSITIDGKKSKTSNKYCNGVSISNDDNVYKIIFKNDSAFTLNIGVNSGGGKFNIPSIGLFTVESYGSTEKGCSSDFDENLGLYINYIKYYQVFDDILLLKGDDFEIELKKE